MKVSRTALVAERQSTASSTDWLGLPCAVKLRMPSARIGHSGRTATSAGSGMCEPVDGAALRFKSTTGTIAATARRWSEIELPKRNAARPRHEIGAETRTALQNRCGANGRTTVRR